MQLYVQRLYMDPSDKNRNPTLIPDPPKEQRRRGCPRCGCPDFDAIGVQGVSLFTCRNKECRNKWQGGLPQEPLRPGEVYPTTDYVPPARFEKDLKTGEFREVRERQDLRPDFKKGLPPPDEEL